MSRAERGASLVELIVAIVVLSIGAGAVLQLVATTVGHSADPMRQQQALAVAEAYLDEILARPVTDPDGTGAGETRATFDNVGDYGGLTEVPRDQSGAALAGLGDYSVTVAVSDVALGPPADTVPAQRIDVRVTAAGSVDVRLSAFRANY